jgi:hypothetical protein
MYFEDIYTKVEPLWEKEFSLEGIEETETYIQDIRRNYNEIERRVDFTHKKDYTEWEGMLTFTMYQALTAYALEKWSKEKAATLSLDEIPITVFEEYFRKNMEPEYEFEGNEEYLKQYQGFRNQPA